jgi:hypothetical protein
MPTDIAELVRERLKTAAELHPSLTGNERTIE